MDLEARVRRLERANRLLVVGLIVGLGGAVAWTPGRTEVLQTNLLEVTDANGVVRIALEAPASGPFVRIFDEHQVERALLTDDEDGTRLFLNDSEGDTRVGMAQFSHGGGGYALHGPKGKGAAVLYLKGEGSLSFIDTVGVVTHRVPAG